MRLSVSATGAVLVGDSRAWRESEARRVEPKRDSAGTGERDVACRFLAPTPKRWGGESCSTLDVAAAFTSPLQALSESERPEWIPCRWLVDSVHAVAATIAGLGRVMKGATLHGSRASHAPVVRPVGEGGWGAIRRASLGGGKARRHLAESGDRAASHAAL